MKANPGWAAMFVLGRVIALRHLRQRLLAAASGLTPNGSDATAVSVQARTESVVKTLRAEGIYAGLSLAPEIVENIRLFAEMNVCYGSFDRSKPFLAADYSQAQRRYGCRFLIGHFLETIETCSAATRVVQDKRVRQIAATYLRREPKLVAHRLWWSFPSSAATPEEASLASQAFHYDLDDWHQIKFFFYLLDVDVTNGPHVYVKGSHRRRPLRFQFSPFVGRPEADIRATYGASAVTTMTGHAGFGFVEDPFGYHAGMPVREGKRLILELSFGVSDLLKQRRYGAISDR